MWNSFKIISEALFKDVNSNDVHSIVEHSSTNDIKELEELYLNKIVNKSYINKNHLEDFVKWKVKAEIPHYVKEDTSLLSIYIKKLFTLNQFVKNNPTLVSIETQKLLEDKVHEYISDKDFITFKLAEVQVKCNVIELQIKASEQHTTEDINKILLEITGDPKIKKHDCLDLSFYKYFKMPITSEIHIRDILLDKSKISLLCMVLKHSDLTHLTIVRTQISDIEASLLAEILPYTQIYNLNLSNNNIGQVGLRSIATTLPNSKVTNLNISGKQLSNNLIHIIPLIINKDNKLTELNIGCHPMWKDKTIELLSKHLRSSNIESLNLSNVEMWDGDFETLIKGLKGSKVSKLDISNNREITDRTIITLIENIVNTQINTLNITYTEISTIGTSKLADMLEKNHLITDVIVGPGFVYGPYATPKTHEKINLALDCNKDLIIKLARFLTSKGFILLLKEDAKQILKFYQQANKELLSEQLNKNLHSSDITAEDIYQKINSFIDKNYNGLENSILDNSPQTLDVLLGMYINSCYALTWILHKI